MNIALFALILPEVAAFALPRVGSASLRDLWLARGSIIFLLLGTFLLFLSATPALMIIGKEHDARLESHGQGDGQGAADCFLQASSCSHWELVLHLQPAVW